VATNLMQIRVLFFGALKELVGRSSETIELPEGARVEAVLRHYAMQDPRFEALLPSLALSVNQEYSRADVVLLPGDEVALLPPVSGGEDERPPRESQGRHPLLPASVRQMPLPGFRIHPALPHCHRQFCMNCR